VAYAVAEISLPFPLIAAGEQRVASSLAAILVAAVPLIGAVLAMRFDHSERPTPLRAFGLLIGFGGVVALVGIDVAGRSGELLGAFEILLAAVGYAIGPMVLKHRLSALDPRATMGASLAIAAVLLAPGAALNPPHAVPSAGAIASVLVLGLLCTATAFVIFSVLIGEAGTSRATVITYVNPVVALVLGVALLGEQPGAGALAGLVLILTGCWLATATATPGSVAVLSRGVGGKGRALSRRAWTSGGTGPTDAVAAAPPLPVSPGGETSRPPGPQPPRPTTSRDLDEDDRVDREQDREQDRPAVEVALDQRAAAERTRAGADAEGA
jgi:drug/metabolite transporter (DMT)-like permease